MTENQDKILLAAISKYDEAAQQVSTLLAALQNRSSYFGLIENGPISIGEKSQSFVIDAIPGEVELTISAHSIDGEMSNNTFLCSVQCYNTHGTRLRVNGLNLSASKRVQDYFYIKQGVTHRQSTRFSVPPGTRQMIIEFMRYKKDSNAVLHLNPEYSIFPCGIDDAMENHGKKRTEMMRAISANQHGSNAEDQKYSAISWLALMDEMTKTCYSGLVENHPLGRQNFANQIIESKHDCLFLESVWNADKWAGCMTFNNPHHPQRLALNAAIMTAKLRDLPVAFYNKEDPMHFEKFLPVAKQADVIFTSDSDMIEEYRKHVPASTKVECLPFAAPADLTNPLGAKSFEDRDTVAFAGTWYGENHDDRIEQMRYMLEPIVEFGGTIYDRMSGQPQARYRYPEPFAQHCVPSVPYERIIQEYRNYKVFLNVNTITQSPTMLARRVYELLACGTPVVSAPSRAIQEQFGSLVDTVDNASDACDAVRRLITDQEYWEKRAHLGYRHVMSNHTCIDRIATIEKAFNIDRPGNFSYDPLVSIIIPSKGPADHLRIVENVTQQTYRNLEVVIGFGLDYTDETAADLLQRLQAASEAAGQKLTVRTMKLTHKITLGHKLNLLIELAQGEYIARMDDDDFYGANYIRDAILPIKWGGFDVVGKGTMYVYDENLNQTYLKTVTPAHKQTHFVAGPTTFGRRSLFRTVQYDDRTRGEDTFMLSKLLRAGARIYSADPYNFIYLRRSGAHTYTLPANYYTNQAWLIGEGRVEEPVMI